MTAPESLLDPPTADGGPRKRRRLTHLSPEERMMRRKLKNRVAAQTARDRKKARMDSLEDQMAKLESENQRLHRENELLRLKTGNLTKENSMLKRRLEGDQKSESVTSTDTPSVVVKSEHGPESAVLCTPQQKERVQSLLLLTTHCMACLLTWSLTYCWSSCSSSQKPQLSVGMTPQQAQPLDLRVDSRQPRSLHTQWWGRHQRNWNPSMN